MHTIQLLLHTCLSWALYQIPWFWKYWAILTSKSHEQAWSVGYWHWNLYFGAFIECSIVSIIWGGLNFWWHGGQKHHFFIGSNSHVIPKMPWVSEISPFFTCEMKQTILFPSYKQEKCCISSYILFFDHTGKLGQAPERPQIWHDKQYILYLYFCWQDLYWSLCPFILAPIYYLCTNL